MEPLIEVINKLQDVCTAVAIPLPIDLPQIVVVGSQSSGKSSVIESIVRREFLPRGQGIVTRRPLVIRLIKINDSNDVNSSVDWVRFKHLERDFTEFDEVREEIERETEKLCGANKGISSEPIVLRVYSRKVVNLTLVDLPGLIKNPVGDQPEDIEIQIEELVMKYIKNPNSIILAVTAANIDFATSEAIKLARKVDPDGRRTLAVLTKLDIMDPGTNALDVLSGKLINIRLGIIGVVNRSQQEIIDKKSIDESIADEAKFLQKYYPSVADKMGQNYLSKRLSQLLMHHIRDCIPDLKDKIKSLTSECQAQLNSYGDAVADKAKTILEILTKFSVSYCDAIKGGQQMKATELCVGARIHYIFHESFGRALSAINPLENLDSKAILTTARNNAGVSSNINVHAVFEQLVIIQIKRLEEPSLRCVDLVYEEMDRLVRQCGNHLDLIRFPKLREKIEEILNHLLEERLPITRQSVKDLVGDALAYIDTDHPRLAVEVPKSLQAVGDNPSPRHDREFIECEYIANKIAAYFSVVREEIKVFVPRAIMRCMVNHIKSNLHIVLTKGIYHQELFDGLLSESDDIARRRKEATSMLEALKRASDIINSIDHRK